MVGKGKDAKESFFRRWIYNWAKNIKRYGPLLYYYNSLTVKALWNIRSNPFFIGLFMVPCVLQKKIIIKKCTIACLSARVSKVSFYFPFAKSVHAVVSKYTTSYPSATEKNAKSSNMERKSTTTQTEPGKMTQKLFLCLSCSEAQCVQMVSISRGSQLLFMYIKKGALLCVSVRYLTF